MGEGGKYKLILDADALHFGGPGRVPHDPEMFSEPEGVPGALRLLRVRSGPCCSAATMRFSILSCNPWLVHAGATVAKWNHALWRITSEAWHLLSAASTQQATTGCAVSMQVSQRQISTTGRTPSSSRRQAALWSFMPTWTMARAGTQQWLALCSTRAAKKLRPLQCYPMRACPCPPGSKQ